MGVLEELTAHPVAQRFLELGVVTQVAAALGSFVFLSIFWHIVRQVLFKNPNEPPEVFSWLPWFGSTIVYGMDPPTFFAQNRAKVCYTRPMFPSQGVP